MTNSRLVRKKEAREVKGGNQVIREYFMNVVPNLGLAVATITDRMPPKGQGEWAINERVDEMFYVIQGTAKLVYGDGQAIKLEPESAAYIPSGVKFRVEEARALRVVVPTGPAWTPEQHKWLGA